MQWFHFPASSQNIRDYIKSGTNNSVASVHERTIPTERPPLVGEVSANFGGCMGVAWSASAADPYSRILGFLDLRRYYFVQVAPQLYSRGSEKLRKQNFIVGESAIFSVAEIFRHE
jgi:hypothetical protein